jgi:hypothetical protein
MLDEGQDFAYELAFDLLLKVSSYIFGFFDVEAALRQVCVMREYLWELIKPISYYLGRTPTTR